MNNNVNGNKTIFIYGEHIIYTIVIENGKTIFYINGQGVNNSNISIFDYSMKESDIKEKVRQLQ